MFIILSKIKSYIEPNQKIRKIEMVLLCLMIIGSVFSFAYGSFKVNEDYGNVNFVKEISMKRDFDEEDYDDNATVYDVVYRNGDDSLIVSYNQKQYDNLKAKSITAYQYKTDNNITLFFNHKNPTKNEVNKSYTEIMASKTMPIFNLGTSLIILFLSLGLIFFFSKAFTLYEKSWFMSIMVLATIVGVAFPEESANGVNGIIIMLLYLLDTFFNILCELLISKQSRYNFLVSLVVEVLEIAICIVLMYRFASMVTTLFFWIPIDIVSYINWSRHKDNADEDLTVVRKLKGYQEVLIILAIILWTVVVGYFLSGLNIQTDFFNGNTTLATIVTYIDACASAVGVANGIFIFFRLQEQWIAWYLSAGLEAIINIISGQYVLLVLKFGYFTNTTYGYIKWNRYIKNNDKA